MAATDTFEEEIINYFLRNQAVTQPATVYLALSTTTPTEAGGNFTEPSGNGYARQAITFGAPSGTGSSTNTNVITFGPNTTTDWGTITYIGIFFASTGGTVRLFRDTIPKAVVVGGSVSWAVGTLTASFN